MDTAVPNPAAFDSNDESAVPGLLDNTLDIFERHGHPFILVGALATRWSGCNAIPDREIDILIDSSAIQPVIDDLVAEEWSLCHNPYIYCTPKGSFVGESTINTMSHRDIWLKSHKRAWLFPQGLFLRLWPQDLYHLSIDCQKIQVLDIFPTEMVTFEEEYYRDPLHRFGPNLASDLNAKSRPILRPAERRFRKVSPVPIHIPRIEDHLNALLDQSREERMTNLQCGNDPKMHISRFIRYHIWDWPPASEWLLANKIRARNYEDMKYQLDRYMRKPHCSYDSVLGKFRLNYYPWDFAPRPELEAIIARLGFPSSSTNTSLEERMFDASLEMVLRQA